MRTLWDNFYAGRADLSADVSREVARFGPYRGHDGAELPYAKTWWTHSPVPPADLSDAVYLVRDGRDVALSMVRFGSSASYAELFEQWRDHVDAYRTRRVYTVRYEDLIRDGTRVVYGIAGYYNLCLLGDEPVIDDSPVGWQPSGARRVARWRTDMSPDMIRRFDQIVPIDHPGRYDVK